MTSCDAPFCKCVGKVCDSYDPRPCKGNANVCAAEGCFGEACVRNDDAALVALAEARLTTDDGVRHDLDDVAREFGVTE